MSVLNTFIVEDSPVIRQNLTAALEEMAPLKVIGDAEDESGAIAWLTQCADRCDVVIIDLFLREGSGLAVLRELQAHPADGPHGTPAERIVLTNYATDEMRRQCFSLGASRVFDKSNEIDALIDHCLDLAARQEGQANTADALPMTGLVLQHAPLSTDSFPIARPLK